MGKKLFLSVLSIAALAGLAGCFDNGQPEADSSNERSVKVMFAESAYQKVRLVTPISEEIRKQTQIRLVYEAIPASNYNEKKKTLLATRNLPDIIQIDKQDINDFASTGVLLPLTNYMKTGMTPNFSALWNKYPELKSLTLDGELYGFPAIARNEAKNGFGPVIRVDLLEKHGLRVPRTFDELLTTLSALKQFYPDSVPWSIRKGTNHLLETSAYMLGSGYGIYYDQDQDGGRYVFGPASPQFKRVLSYLRRAYELGVLDPDYAVTTQQQWSEKLVAGQSFFFLDNSGFGLNYTRSVRRTNPEASFQLIPVPVYMPGKSRAFYYPTISGKVFAVSAKTKDADTVVKLLDWMYSEETSNLMNFGLEGVHYTKNEKGEPVYSDSYAKSFKDASPTPYYALYSDLGCCQLGFTPLYSNTMSQFQIEKLTGNWDELNEEYWRLVSKDPAYRELRLDPPLTMQEAQRVKELNRLLNDKLEQEFDKYIMGVKPIDEYDGVIAQAMELGAAELEQIYNQALKRFQQNG
ncbi:extracellular solute-binding protein [Paenibacillus silviterrae]|uniref:extracellular solute-binding protein n=1 Tax=Paenibacillus silviterrae TaxID=3242194 RepID=UPI002543D338|nr:extracellular solute-binding protein [Paenibacillus chinjuensis]